MLSKMIYRGGMQAKASSIVFNNLRYISSSKWYACDAFSHAFIVEINSNLFAFTISSEAQRKDSTHDV